MAPSFLKNRQSASFWAKAGRDVSYQVLLNGYWAFDRRTKPKLFYWSMMLTMGCIRPLNFPCRGSYEMVTVPDDATAQLMYGAKPGRRLCAFRWISI